MAEVYTHVRVGCVVEANDAMSSFMMPGSHIRTPITKSASICNVCLLYVGATDCAYVHMVLLGRVLTEEPRHKTRTVISLFRP